MLDLFQSYQDRGLTVQPFPAGVTTEAFNLSDGQPPSADTAVACKFILLARDNHYMMVFGALPDYPYHADLLEKFCQERQIARHWIKRPDQLQLEDPRYRMLGGGYIDLENGKRKARISGSSKAYGFFDSEAVEWVTRSAEFFADFAVRIEL
jgi:hypothetical protein